MRVELLPDQERIFQRAKRYSGFILGMEQRTGKTPTACALIEYHKPATLLIMCPKLAIGVWEAHLTRYDIHTFVDVRIVNFEGTTKSVRRSLRRWTPDMVIGDELHRIKNPHSRQSRALRSIAKVAKWRYGLTGTLIEKGIQNAWAQFDFIDETIFGLWGDFKERYLVLGGFMGKKIIGDKNRDEFDAKMHSRYARLLLEDAKEVPTVIAPHHLVRFDLEESREAYDSMEHDLIVEIIPERVVRQRVIDPATGVAAFQVVKHRIVAPRVITQATKLHQLAGGFIFDENKAVHRIGDEKLMHLGCLVLELGDVPIVIFTKFNPELNRIACLLRILGRKVTCVSGKHKGYVSGTPFDVIVVQIRSGIAIDLSHAEEAIFYSWNHSFIDYDQAKFRIRSYTSVRARYHFLIANGTVDEELYTAVTSKANFSSLIVDKFLRRQS